MIIPDFMLCAWASKGGLTPFEPAMINPASIDLRWSGRYRVAYSTGWGDLHEDDSLNLLKGKFFLLDTLEKISMPRNWVGTLALKSSMGRQGMEHLHAGYVDCGFGLLEPSTLTLEVENRAPWILTIRRGQPIVQISMALMLNMPEKDYSKTGRYNGQDKPQESK